MAISHTTAGSRSSFRDWHWYEVLQNWVCLWTSHFLVEKSLRKVLQTCLKWFESTLKNPTGSRNEIFELNENPRIAFNPVIGAVRDSPMKSVHALRQSHNEWLLDWSIDWVMYRLIDRHVQIDPSAQATLRHSEVYSTSQIVQKWSKIRFLTQSSSSEWINYSFLLNANEIIPRNSVSTISFDSQLWWI
jgi:hypothetical protein